MHSPEIQMLQVGRRRARYSAEFKRQVISACLEPGVSTAAFALANVLTPTSIYPKLPILIDPAGCPWNRCYVLVGRPRRWVSSKSAPGSNPN